MIQVDGHPDCWPCGWGGRRAGRARSQKLFSWFGGYGPSGTGQWMDSLDFAGSGKNNAVLAGLGEFGGEVLLALGLATGPGRWMASPHLPRPSGRPPT